MKILLQRRDVTGEYDLMRRGSHIRRFRLTIKDKDRHRDQHRPPGDL